MNTARGIALALFSFGIFSVGDAFVKLQAIDYDLMTVIFYATATGTFFLLAISRLFGGLQSILKPKNPRLQLIRTLCLGTQFLLLAYAFTQIPLAAAYTFIFAAPLIAAVLSALFLHEHLDKRQALAVISGFIGVLVVVRPGMIPMSVASFAALFSALLFAVGNLVVRRMDPDETPLAMGFYPTIAVFIATGFITLFQGFVLPPFEDLWMMMAVGLCSGVGLMAMGTAVKIAPATVVLPFHYTQLIWGTLFGLFLFGDLPDGFTYAGAAIIIGSGFYLIRHSAGKQA